MFSIFHFLFKISIYTFTIYASIIHPNPTSSTSISLKTLIPPPLSRDGIKAARSFSTYSISISSDLATCLSQKNIAMYGINWCEFCKEQKQLFGESAKNLIYIECDPRIGSPSDFKICKQNNFKNFPTWKKPNGETLTGLQSLEALSTWANCSF